MNLQSNKFSALKKLLMNLQVLLINLVSVLMRLVRLLRLSAVLLNKLTCWHLTPLLRQHVQVHKVADLQSSLMKFVNLQRNPKELLKEFPRLSMQFKVILMMLLSQCMMAQLPFVRAVRVLKNFVQTLMKSVKPQFIPPKMQPIW